MMVVLEQHSPDWAKNYQAEATAIVNIFGANLVGIHHIGSTAVPDLLAKPIIDLMAEVRNLRACDDVTKAMTIFGYEAMGTNGIAGRRYFRKFDKDRRRTHHLHVFGQGSEHLERHLAFRDYLIAHPEEAKQYSALKQRLVAIDDGDWDAYVSGKTRFVQEREALALAWYAKASR